MAIQFDHTANGLVTITTTNAASPSPYTLRLPNGTGSSGQFLSTDGTGNLSFTSAATSYENLASKAVANVILSGDVAGTANVVLQANSTVIAITTTIQPNSVALGTDTTGDYVTSVTQGSGITITGGTGEGSTPTISANVTSVGTFVGAVSNANILSSLLQVDGTGSNLDADLLDGQQGTYYLAWANQTGKPAVNVEFTGDVTGAGNVILTNSNTNSLSIALTVAANSVALGTDTTGNYVSNVVAGTGLLASGGGSEGAVVTVSLPNSGVVANTYGNASIVPVITVDAQGRITSASNVAIDTDYSRITNKPSLNVTFTGDVTGAANLNISNTSTNALSVELTVAANSVALGTDTTGNYTNRVIAGTGTTVSGTADEGNVITVGLSNTGVVANTYGNARIIPVITVDAQGRITAASNVTHLPDAANIVLTGDVTGAANVILGPGTTNISISTTVAPNSVALGTDTTGNYVSNVIAGAGIVASGGNSENAIVTISHLDTSSVGNVTSDNSNGVVVQDITLGFDTFGHVTSASVATVDLDSRFLRLSSPTTQIVSSYVTFEGNVQFLGNVVSVSANNLVISDNFIYLNDGTSNTNVDFGFVGNYNDGVYRHGGFFRDASDGYFKVFDNYLPEPDAAIDIDTSNVSYREANFKANIFLGNRLDLSAINGNSIVATGNIFTSRNVIASAFRTAAGDTVWHSGNDGTGSGLDADLLDGQNGTYYLAWANQTEKPAINLLFTGDVTGSGNIALTNSNTNSLSVSLTVAANSVALGTDTTGNYTARVVGGTGISATGTADEGNVITVNLSNTGVTANTYGNARIIPVITVDAQGRITAASNVVHLPDAANIVLTGDVTGSANVILGPGTTAISISTTVAANSVALGTDTTGNYTNRVIGGNAITVTGTADEGNVITVSHADTSSVSNVTAVANTYISAVGFDTFGHVTSISTANITGFLSAESDTLATVTGRGNTTSTSVQFTNTTGATSTATGAVRVSGGVGILGNLYVGQVLVSGGHTGAAQGLNSALIAGGLNSVSGANSFVLGGVNNSAAAFKSGIIGGHNNSITADSSNSNVLILGGHDNVVEGVGGSHRVVINSKNVGAFVGGNYSTIIGSDTADIFTTSDHSTIIGSKSTSILSSQDFNAAIATENSSFLGASKYSLILGGSSNEINITGNVYAGGAVIIGGSNNDIGAYAADSAIIGSYLSDITVARSTIINGYLSDISTSSALPVENQRGGSQFAVGPYAYSTIAGKHTYSPRSEIGFSSQSYGQDIIPAPVNIWGVGAAQVGKQLLMGNVVGSGSTVLSSDPSATVGSSNTIALDRNFTVYLIKGTVVASNVTGTVKTFDFTSTAKRGANAASTTFVGSYGTANAIVNTLAADLGTSTWEMQLIRNNSGYVTVRATTGTSDNVKVIASIETTEMQYQIDA